MIKLINVSKKYKTRIGARTILDDVSLQINAGEKIGILGRNGAGKSTIIRLISGAELPTKGQIVRDMNISWPLAFTGGFQGGLTGIDNVKFICRVYGADIAKAIAEVEDFSELGIYLREPVRSYSSGMRARLAFALSMAIDFDCFLIDEVVAVGDSRFHDKCKYELFDKRRHKSMIIVSHIPEMISEYCDRAVVLHKGKLIDFISIEEAFYFYNETMNTA